jgi:hypothetical protein
VGSIIVKDRLTFPAAAAAAATAAAAGVCFD